MIPFFAGYAVLVWYAALRWRRRWESFAWVLAGILGLVLVALLHIQLSRWTRGGIYLPVLQCLLYPYAALVGGIGLYLACLPRRVVAAQCLRCQYDLAGLAGEAEQCPECGLPTTPIPARPSRGPRPEASAPACPPGPAIAGQIVCLDPADQ